MMDSLTTDDTGARTMTILKSNLTDAFADLAEAVANGNNGDAVIGDVGISVSVADDYDANPRDADCYSADDLARFDAGEWKYIGIKLTVAVGNVESEASVWNVDHGYNRDGEITHVREDLLPALFDDIKQGFATAAERIASL